MFKENFERAKAIENDLYNLSKSIENIETVLSETEHKGIDFYNIKAYIKQVYRDDANKSIIRNSEVSYSCDSEDSLILKKAFQDIMANKKKLYEDLKKEFELL